MLPKGTATNLISLRLLTSETVESNVPDIKDGTLRQGPSTRQTSGGTGP
ncbi:hypothetical protein CSPAE12_01938 [Colletotrichum incanum]|nr:hypothetical protein CSPAE12_01938 [Colletotrichum incanum]